MNAVANLLNEWEREGRFPSDPNVLVRLRAAIEADREGRKGYEERWVNLDRHGNPIGGWLSAPGAGLTRVLVEPSCPTCGGWKRVPSRSDRTFPGGVHGSVACPDCGPVRSPEPDKETP